MRILTAADVRALITMREAIDAVREGFAALSTGRATVPVRTHMPVGDGLTLTMPAYVQGSPVSAVKIVSVYPGNTAKNLPVVIGSVLALDSQTGAPLALIDGGSLTAIRTGAASGLATELLSRPDAAVLGLIGAGVQARTQIEAICTVRAIREIRLHSRRGADQLADELRSKYPAEIIVARSAHEALSGADIITAATNSTTPVVNAGDIAPGVHINGVGSFMPTMQEVAAEVVSQAKIVVDHRPGVWEEAGDLIMPRDSGLIHESDVHAEIGEIAAGLKPGRESADEITFFKSVGNAVQDAVVAARLVKLAEERGAGSVVAR